MIAQLTENAFLLSYLWQSTAFVAAGLAISFALRRRPSRAHHMLLLAIIAAVVMPLATASVKHLGLGLFTAEPVAIHPPIESVTPRQHFENQPENIAPAPLALTDSKPARSYPKTARGRQKSENGYRRALHRQRPRGQRENRKGQDPIVLDEGKGRIIRLGHQ